jgi:hypothetical protein
MKRDIDLLPRLRLWHGLVSRVIERTTTPDPNNHPDLVRLKHGIEEAIDDILSLDSNEF